MKYVQNKKIAFQVYDGEAVLVDPAGAVCRVLNDTATRVWELCATACTVAELVRRLQAEYDVEPDRLKADIEELVNELAAKDLFEETVS